MVYHIVDKCSTLTSIDEPYPMLVLCGPRGSGKGYLSKRLVGDFPDFFGMGYVIYLPDEARGVQLLLVCPTQPDKLERMKKKEQTTVLSAEIFF